KATSYWLLAARSQKLAAPLGSLFRWNFKLHDVVAEEARAPRAVGNPHAQPDGAGDLCRRAQVPPDERADKEPQGWRQEVGQTVFRRAKVVAHERRGIHAHEGNERAKIQQLRSALVGHGKGASQRQASNEQHVVAWNAVDGIDVSEKAARQGLPPPHSIEETRGSKLGRHAGTDVGDQDGEVQEVEQKVSANLAGHQGKG